MLTLYQENYKYFNYIKYIGPYKNFILLLNLCNYFYNYPHFVKEKTFKESLKICLNHTFINVVELEFEPR